VQIWNNLYLFPRCSFVDTVIYFSHNNNTASATRPMRKDSKLSKYLNIFSYTLRFVLTLWMTYRSFVWVNVVDIAVSVFFYVLIKTEMRYNASCLDATLYSSNTLMFVSELMSFTQECTSIRGEGKLNMNTRCQTF